MTGLLNETAFLKAFSSCRAEAIARVPFWLKESRAEDMEALEGLAPLSVRDEEWKYTSLAALWRQEFVPAMRAGGVRPAVTPEMIIPGAVNILLCNGHYLGEIHGHVPATLTVTSGEAAFAALSADFRYAGAMTTNDAALFTKLNRAFFCDPLGLRLSRAEGPGPLIHLIHLVTRDAVSVFPRILVHLDARACGTVMETFVSSPGSRYLAVPVTDIIIEEGASLEYAQKHCNAPDAFHVGAVRAWVKKEGTFRSLLSARGAEVFRHHLSVALEEEGASVRLNGLHVLDGEAHADSHTMIEHLAPNTSSDQLYKCVLEGASRSVFNGKIKVHREARQTNSYQLNKNLLLGRECHADTKPQLEIMADDVKCTHGATIGQLNDDQLFYLQTRCIAREEAARMLVRGFIDDVLGKTQHPSIRKYAL